MYKYAFVFGKFYQLTHIGVAVFKNDVMVHPDKIEEYYVIRENDDFRHFLMKKADLQDVPVLFQDEHKVVFACIKKEDEYVFMGPIATTNMSKIELHRFYFSYGMRKGIERALPVLNFGRILAGVELLAERLLNKNFLNEELLKNNGINNEIESSESVERVCFQIENEEDTPYHHSFINEKEALDYIREGKTEEAIKASIQLDSQVGIMSKDPIQQWKKLVIVAVALSIRAAIDGGISPAEAYEISDFYNQQMDKCKTETELIEVKNKAIKELANRVYEKQNHKPSSSYIEQCCEYVNKNYREKIYISKIAELLGISTTYLSKIFVKEKGITLQEYIVKVRVEHAANLLVYSNESLTKISDYVNFPSQSYFGRVFRQYMDMTPKQYRERYKPKEF